MPEEVRRDLGGVISFLTESDQHTLACMGTLLRETPSQYKIHYFFGDPRFN